MESRMKKTPWILATSLLILVMMLGIGCSEKSSGGGGTVTGIAAVQIWMPSDTLKFLPGDSAIVEGWVAVTNNEGNVVPGVKVSLTLSAGFGSIEFVDAALRDTTNEIGRVYFRFRSYQQTGVQTITAAAGGKSAQWQLVVQAAPEVVAFLAINLSRNQLEIPTGLQDSVQVSVTISDSARIGISGISLRLQATGGTIAPLPPTDDAGRTSTWWYFSNEEGVFEISVRAGGLTRTAQITVTEQPTQGTLLLTTSHLWVRADDGVSTARITATLKNQLGVAVKEATIYFAAPGKGTIEADVITDSTGTAVTYFSGGSIPSENPFDSALVIARYLDWQLADTVRIFIEPPAQIPAFALRAGILTGIAGVDSTPINTTVLYEDGQRVSGLKINYYTTCGGIPVYRNLTNGIADTAVYYKYCNVATSTDALVWATVTGSGSAVPLAYSDTLSFYVVPGPARRVVIGTSSERIPINEQMDVWAAITDSFNNPVSSGVPVMFSSTLGTLSPESPVQTETDGFARCTLTPGTAAGPSIIKASIAAGAIVDSTLITIQSGGAATISLGVSYPSPQVRGTGGQDWTQLLARVKDINGNPAPDGVWVTFEIMSSPGGGANINGRGTLDSAQTSAGLATATFNSGTTPGPVLIQARAFTNGQVITATASNITVVSGPPAHIDIQASDVGTDAEGAAWDVVVTALVYDSYSNPVRDSIAVFFSIFPDTATILSDTAFTGNGPHRPGVCYTTLRYLSAATNEMVQITGRTAGDDGVTETVDYLLPLQDPTISLYPQPVSWHFGAQGDPCRIECWAILRDGHNVLINGSKVIYNAQRGRLYLDCNQTTNPTTYNYTGHIRGFENGKTMLCLKEQATYIFPTPDAPEITGDIQVEVEGYPEAIDTQIINFRRGQGLTDRGPIQPAQDN